MPEMVFAENILQVTHKFGTGMEFSALEALLCCYMLWCGMGWGGEVLDPIGRYIDYALCELPVGVLLLRVCTYSGKKTHKFHQN